MRDVFPANEDAGTNDESGPEFIEDARSGEHDAGEPTEEAVVSDDVGVAADESLPQEAASEVSPPETEEPPAAPIVESAEEVSPLAEPPASPEPAPASVEAASAEVVPRDCV